MARTVILTPLRVSCSSGLVCDQVDSKFGQDPWFCEWCVSWNDTCAGGIAVFDERWTTGAVVLVRPTKIKEPVFLSCCYGHATTILRSQGSSLHLGALWSGHLFLPGGGYGYLGASGLSIQERLVSILSNSDK